MQSSILRRKTDIVLDNAHLLARAIGVITLSAREQRAVSRISEGVCRDYRPQVYGLLADNAVKDGTGRTFVSREDQCFAAVAMLDTLANEFRIRAERCTAPSRRSEGLTRYGHRITSLYLTALADLAHHSTLFHRGTHGNELFYGEGMTASASMHAEAQMMSGSVQPRDVSHLAARPDGAFPVKVDRGLRLVK